MNTIKIKPDLQKRKYLVNMRVRYSVRGIEKHEVFALAVHASSRNAALVEMVENVKGLVPTIHWVPVQTTIKRY